MNIHREHLSNSVVAEVEEGKIKLIVKDSRGFNIIRLSPIECLRLTSYVTRNQAVIEEVVPPVYTTDHGLLYKNGIELSVGQADAVARDHGYGYAEQFVAFLAEQKKEPVKV